MRVFRASAVLSLTDTASRAVLTTPWPGALRAPFDKEQHRRTRQLGSLNLELVTHAVGLRSLDSYPKRPIGKSAREPFPKSPQARKGPDCLESEHKGWGWGGAWADNQQWHLRLEPWPPVARALLIIL